MVYSGHLLGRTYILFTCPIEPDEIVTIQEVVFVKLPEIIGASRLARLLVSL